MNRQSLKRYIYPVLLVLAAGISGCEISQTVADDSGGSNAAISITMTPSEATLIAGDARQFFASVSGTVITSVTWSVASGPGLIDINGIYEAPYPIDVDTVVAVIKAVPDADPSKSATATVKIVKPVEQGPKCDTANITYAAVVKPILQLNCYGCHSGANPPRGLNLSLYTSVKGVASDGKLYGAISHEQGFPAMPKGANKLDDCSIAKIKAWIDRGAQND